MNRKFALLWVVTLALVLAACGSSDSPNDNTGGDSDDSDGSVVTDVPQFSSAETMKAAHPAIKGTLGTVTNLASSELTATVMSVPFAGESVYAPMVLQSQSAEDEPLPRWVMEWQPENGEFEVSEHSDDTLIVRWPYEFRDVTKDAELEIAYTRTEFHKGYEWPTNVDYQFTTGGTDFGRGGVTLTRFTQLGTCDNDDFYLPTHLNIDGYLGNSRDRLEIDASAEAKQSGAELLLISNGNLAIESGGESTGLKWDVELSSLWEQEPGGSYCYEALVPQTGKINITLESNDTSLEFALSGAVRYDEDDFVTGVTFGGHVDLNGTRAFEVTGTIDGSPNVQFTFADNEKRTLPQVLNGLKAEFPELNDTF